MSAPALAFLAIVMVMAAPAASLAQQGPRIDVLTGEPVRPRRDNPRPEPEIFNAPHAPRQERRADDPPVEIYVTPQLGAQQDPYAGGVGPGAYRSGQPQIDRYAPSRLPPPIRHGRRVDDALPR